MSTIEGLERESQIKVCAEPIEEILPFCMHDMDNRSHHSMIPSTPMDRYLQERPYGQQQQQQHQQHQHQHQYQTPQHQQQALQHSQSFATQHVQQQPTSPTLERTHKPPPPASPHHSPQSASPTGSSPTNSFNLGASSHQQAKRRRVPTEERKRTAMSCDRCKSRKIKVPPPFPATPICFSPIAST